MHLRHILSALSRHKTILALLVVVTAVSCAVVSNSVFLLSLRQQRLQMPAGFAEHSLVELVGDNLRQDDEATAQARTDETLAALRRIPGVEAATLGNLAPFDWSEFRGGGIALSSADAEAHAGPIAAFYVGEDLAHTLGLRLLAGRWLNPAAFVDYAAFMHAEGNGAAPAETLLTQALAQRLWPGQNPLGRQLYFHGSHPVTVVGVIEHLPRPVISDDGGADYSLVLPMHAAIGQGGVFFLLRATDPAQRDRVLHAAVAVLRAQDPHRVIETERPLAEARDEQLGADRSMAWILIGLCAALLLVTGLGMVGLSSYWVMQRRRQIGVRRALGATRADIVRHFMAENFLLTTAGIVAGMALAYGLSRLLMAYYELPRLPLAYFPVGAIALWLTGQLAVLAPALRAAAIAPATAAN